MIGEAQIEQRVSTKEEIARMYLRYLRSYKKAEAYGAQLLSIGERVFIYLHLEDSHLQLQQIQGANPTYHPSPNSCE